MATLELLRDILTFPLVIWGELQQEEYLAALVAGVSACYVFGVPNSADTWQQLGVAYLGTGALVVGTKYLMEFE